MTQKKMFRVYCLPTSLVLDPLFPASSTTILYSLGSDQSLTVDGAAGSMVAPGYTGSLPSFVHDPAQCDPAQNK
jgi:hypothetical protein